MAQGWTVSLRSLKFMVAPIPPLPTLKMFLVLFLPAAPPTRGTLPLHSTFQLKEQVRQSCCLHGKVSSRLCRWCLPSFTVLSPLN